MTRTSYECCEICRRLLIVPDDVHHINTDRPYCQLCVASYRESVAEAENTIDIMEEYGREDD